VRASQNLSASAKSGKSGNSNYTILPLETWRRSVLSTEGVAYGELLAAGLLKLIK